MGIKKIYVGNLPFSTTDAQLKNFFEQCGEITSVKIITDKETGRSKGFGFVEFTDTACVESAIALDGNELAGEDGRSRPLSISEAREREPRSATSSRQYAGSRG